MQSVCGDTTCSMNDKGDHEPRMDECRLASSLLQFFELASEGWFLCVSLDIRVSLNNPFSNYTSRMLRYHIISWTLGLVTAVLMYTSGLQGFTYSSDLKSSHADDFGAEENSIYGFWYITQDVDDTVFCWFKSDNKSDLLRANVSIDLALLTILGGCFVHCGLSVVSNVCGTRLGRGSFSTSRFCLCTCTAWSRSSRSSRSSDRASARRSTSAWACSCGTAATCSCTFCTGSSWACCT